MKGRKNCLAALFAASAAALFSGAAPAAAGKTAEKPVAWRLVWKDDFTGPALDETRWSRIPPEKTYRYGSWISHMSLSPEVVGFRDGNLILSGRVNADTNSDPRPYLTGGVWTRGKFTMQCGKVEIRAKLGSAAGAWPAFWMMPADPRPRERYAEIDILEHLNRDAFVYQTIHTHYTLHLGRKRNPLSHATAPIVPGAYNVYSLEWLPEKIVYAVNGKTTFVYPRIETDVPGQWTFDSPFYLMLDMQLGGGWVGPVNPGDLPVEVAIDWVKFYSGRRGAESVGRFWHAGRAAATVRSRHGRGW